MKTSTPYIIRALNNPKTLFEGVEDVKAVVSESLDGFALIDMPVVCASLRLLAAAMEQAMGDDGRKVLYDILSNTTVVHSGLWGGMQK